MIESKPAVCDRGGIMIRSLLWPPNRWARRVYCCATDVAFETCLSCGREIQDVDGLRAGCRVRNLDPRISKDHVLSDHRLPCPRADEYSVGVASDVIAVDQVSSRGADDTDPKIIRRYRVPIAMCRIQPDPAVVAGDSYAAARRPRGGRTIAHRNDAFHQCSKRRGCDKHARPAIG